jgi:hypothetical protein
MFTFCMTMIPNKSDVEIVPEDILSSLVDVIIGLHADVSLNHNGLVGLLHFPMSA